MSNLTPFFSLLNRELKETKLRDETLKIDSAKKDQIIMDLRQKLESVGDNCK